MMSSQPNGGHANGVFGSYKSGNSAAPKSKRFSDIPSTLDIPVQGQEDEAVEIDLQDLADDPTELCSLFEMERAARTYWMTVALAYAKQNKIDYAIEVLQRGAAAMQLNNPREKLSIVTCLCWMYLWKSRDAPRVAPEGALISEAKTKEYYLQLATQNLNEASRINPAFPPLFLARGVLLLLKASLQTPSKTTATGPAGIDPEKGELLRSAIKSFDDASRVSQGKNMLAVMGKARAQFSLGKYAESLASYQDVLSKMPDLVDPDPRIGIGCCFWQLGHKEDAMHAWQRSLEINPESKVANILIGIYYLEQSGRVSTDSPEFPALYKKAMTEYTQKAFKIDKNLPLTCATFANYFLSRKQYQTVDTLAHRAIQNTDVNAIASDGWYILARKEQLSGDLERAADYYRRADDARGGMERGYLPAKFGAAQLSVIKNDMGESKLRLEKMSQQSKTYEVMVLLGTLYAEEVFASQDSSSKEDKSAETKKAIQLLESARTAWKDPKKNLAPDSAVLLNLARLYEGELPEKALQCLQQVEQLELDNIPESKYPEGETDQGKILTAIRKHLPPQLLNNIGCFYFQEEKYALASDFFQAALDACVRLGENGEKKEGEDENDDTDALVTTIGFNLGRSYEAEGQLDRAVECYEGLLKRHADYTDARTRLAYLTLRRQPNEKAGPDAVAKLYQENPTDLEVRALYGWFLGKSSKKRPQNMADDPEHRHYKHTLQNYDKHDRYALVGMGNMHLLSAREMRRETEADRQKRSAVYSRAVEFFDKALQLDPKNAYAAQGIAIALVEDKKDYKNALQIFMKVRETIKDASLYVNLGHIYAELKQWSKAVESYETALSKEGKVKDADILSCLGRTWLNRGRAERNLDGYKNALDYARKALEVAPDQLHFKFNVAFVQIQLAMLINSLRESERTSFQLEEASDGLEAAIKALDEIAGANHPPYPKHDIEQRANMARNTQRKQLERAMASQKEYEARNQERLAKAMEIRKAELRKREEAKRQAEEAERERQEKIKRDREAIAARDRALAEARAEEERQRMEAELTTDSETGDKVKRQKKKPTSSGRANRAGSENAERPARKGRAVRRKKVDRDSGDDGEEDGGGARRKRQKLTRGSAAKQDTGKFKSAEIVVDSDESDLGEEGEDALDRAERALEKSQRRSRSTGSGGGGGFGSGDSGSEDEGARQNRKKGGASARKSNKSGRKSSARAVDTDEEDQDRMDVDDDEDDRRPRRRRDQSDDLDRGGSPAAGGGGDDDEEEAETAAAATRRSGRPQRRRGIVDESDEEEVEEAAAPTPGSPGTEEGDKGPSAAEKADTSMVDADDDDE
ncbi:hypothetical protein V8F06_004326 [Rhypophila decipiens]